MLSFPSVTTKLPSAELSVEERFHRALDDMRLGRPVILVDDFDAGHRQLQAAGVGFLGEPVNRQGNRLLFFADGDGNILHIIQREKPLP